MLAKVILDVIFEEFLVVILSIAILCIADIVRNRSGR
jgi:hypothetical protein